MMTFRVVSKSNEYVLNIGIISISNGCEQGTGPMQIPLVIQWVLDGATIPL